VSVSLTVVVPTIGRPSLRRILQDLAAELRDVDEVLVVGDGPQPQAAAFVDALAPSSSAAVRYFETPPAHFWGNPQRRAAFERARGTHILSFDDDDRVVVGAVGKICATLKMQPERPHLFRLWYRMGLIWSDRKIRESNVGTQMIAFPNRRGRIGFWSDKYTGDYDFVRSTVDLYPDREASVVWCETPIAVHGHDGELAPHPPGSIRE
jgi:hypothetical protein